MDKKFDILVVGELNVDLILNQIHSLPVIGEEILADQMTLTLGSSSAIFASNIRVLGAKTAFVGKVGKDNFGQFVMNVLEEKDIFTGFISTEEREKTGISVILNYPGDRFILTYQGAMKLLSCDDISDDILLSARHLHVSSIFLQPGIRKCLKNLFARAKELNLTTSLDPQWDPEQKWEVAFDEVLPFVDVFLPNEAEALSMTKARDIDRAAEILGDMGNYIIIKMGDKGAMGHYKGKKIIVEPFVNRQVVDAVGAGDSFNAGFVYQYIKNADFEHCLRFGNLMGALNTTAPGGTGAFTSIDEVINKVQKYWNIKLETENNVIKG